MKKLQLRLESLRVESFDTKATDAVRGTVRGRDDTVIASDCPCETDTWCETYIASNCWPYCPSAETCAQSCACQSKPSGCFDCEM
jgi:hypothetical protein